MSFRSTTLQPPIGLLALRNVPRAFVYGVMREVREFFRVNTQHRPSPEMGRALEAIPATVYSIMRSTAEDKFYLSQLDCGIGVPRQHLWHRIEVVI